MTTASTSTQQPQQTLLQPVILPLSFSFTYRKRRFEESFEQMHANDTCCNDGASPHTQKRANTTTTFINVFTDEELQQQQDFGDSSGSQQSPDVERKLIDSGMCTPCWQTRQQMYERREHSNSGLLHTLYAYRQFFVELFALFRQRNKLKKATTETRDAMKNVLSTYGIGYRKRPISLRTPFEEGMKNRFIIFRGWICPSAIRAIHLASMAILLGREQEAFAEALSFIQNVLLPTLIFMHEALARRSKASSSRERTALLRLDSIQDESCEHNDVFMKFLWQSNVTVAEQECAEFRQSQTRERVRYELQRNDHHSTPHHNYMLPEIPLTTMGLLQTVVNDYKSGAIELPATEQRFCEALYRGGRSGADYMLPHQTPVKSRPEHRIEMDSAGKNHFLVTPLETNIATTPPLTTAE